MIPEKLCKLTSKLFNGLLFVFGIGYKVDTRVTKHSFDQSTGKNDKATLLGSNEYRVDYLIYNASGNSIYLAESNHPAGESHYTTQVAANSEFNPGNRQAPYKGEVTYKPAVAGSGYIMVTEYVLTKQR